MVFNRPVSNCWLLLELALLEYMLQLDQNMLLPLWKFLLSRRESLYPRYVVCFTSSFKLELVRLW